uniref:Uncharacterized protein n=1 Tax=Vespula pensylvanica TaxID=30213 RepID=A0A834JSE9_VESPE|nr:hypothetical protein H0235_017113 [Vespula pensylvanica]
MESSRKILNFESPLFTRRKDYWKSSGSYASCSYLPIASSVSMKYIELALRRNKISQRRSKRPVLPSGSATTSTTETEGGVGTAKLNICRDETRVTSQFEAISGGIVGRSSQRYRRWSALREKPIYARTTGIDILLIFYRNA